MQRFYGNADLGEGWELVGMTAKIDGARWSVLRREAHNESDWRMVKVAADGYAKAKANYWLSFDGKRFAGGSEYWKLVEHRFELAKAVIVVLGGEVGNLKPFDAWKAKPGKLNAKEADAYRKLLDGFTAGAPMTAKRPTPSKFGKLNKKRNAC